MAADEFGDPGADFEDFCPGTDSLTVREVDPDDGSETASASGVVGLKRVTRYGEVPAQDGGGVGAVECTFLFRAAAVPFAVRARCEVDDAGGATWVVGDADLIAFGAVWRCPGCVRKR